MEASFGQTAVTAPSGPPDLMAVRRDGAARRIVRAWRTLTGSSRTLVACSGGADSLALGLAIASAERREVVLAHVVHDMRPPEECHADRDAVRAISASLGAPFIERRVHLPYGNAEAGARGVRHDALESMAIETGCRFVATGHHADDQLETMLMALGRGSGLPGLRGVARSRLIGANGVRLVRPMLEVTRRDAERLCRIAGVSWRIDQTNMDQSRRRAALRHRVLPELRRLYPQISAKAASAGLMISDAAEIVQAQAAEVFGEGYSWPRAELRAAPRLVIGEGLRTAFQRLEHGRGVDRLPQREVDRVMDAISDDARRVREFTWPGDVQIVVGAGLVTMSKRSGAESV